MNLKFYHQNSQINTSLIFFIIFNSLHVPEQCHYSKKEYYVLKIRRKFKSKIFKKSMFFEEKLKKAHI